MTLADALLAGVLLMVGVALAWRSDPAVRVVLFASALLVSGLLFLPGDQIRWILGDRTLKAATRLVRDTPWSLSDWAHFILFVWLGLLVWLGRADLRGWKAWCLVLGLAVAAELMQGLAPARSPRLDDVLLNVAGGMAGLLVGMGVLGLRQRRG